LLLVVSLAGVATTADARFRAMQWTPAHATFYGDETAAETMGTFTYSTMAIGAARRHCKLVPLYIC
jgi:hypothetical protein